ncbi:hypothetical protein [Legionella worsleiensis]|uniref:Uncharacterized protein n=1 Tax=Legionella worsleiensis TaxID=45076 RepID=A0A0W1AL71_9GAMM|nr:hypothetical protein [Legionella worsleiensis]KTD81923.1 hypothetical protein Lwor_0226 [Legionella worsleiensis]STY31259.1 Uncharacterised protein [Legionella worsleiensis]
MLNLYVKNKYVRGPKDVRIDIKANNISALSSIEFNLKSTAVEPGYSLNINIYSRDKSSKQHLESLKHYCKSYYVVVSEHQYEFLSLPITSAIAFLQELAQTISQLSQEDNQFLLTTLYGIMPAEDFNDYLNEVMQNSDFDKALTLISSRNSQEQNSLFYFFVEEFRNKGRPDIAKKFFENMPRSCSRYTDAQEAIKQMHFESVTVYDIQWFLSTLECGKGAVSFITSDLVSKVLASSRDATSLLTASVFSKKYDPDLLIHVARLLFECDQLDVASEWFELIAESCNKSHVREECYQQLYTIGTDFRDKGQWPLAKKFCAKIPESSHCYAMAHSVLTQAHFEEIERYDFEWFAAALARGLDAIPLFNQDVIRQILSSCDLSELTPNIFNEPYDNNLLLHVAKLIDTCNHPEIACQWYTAIAERATENSTLRNECLHLLELQKLIEGTNDAIYAEPEARLEFYKLCMDSCKENESQGSLELMQEIMYREISEGRTTLLVEHVLIVSRINSDIFFHAGMELAIQKDYPLLAFCFFEHIRRHNTYFVAAQSEILRLLPIIYPIISSHGAIVNRILDCCLNCRDEDMRDLLKCNQELLLGSSDCSSMLALVEEIKVLKEENSKLKSLLLDKQSTTSMVSSTSIGASFWSKKADSDTPNYASSSTDPGLHR